MNHQQALEILTRFILGEQVRSQDVRDAKMHVSTCPECIHQFADLSRALGGEPSPFQDQTAVLTCVQCLDRLPEYVEDKLSGIDVENKYPQLAQHIRECAGCGAKYRLLWDLVQLDTEAVPTPQYPSFDEQFLFSQAVDEPASTHPAWVHRGRNYLAWLKEELGGVAMVLVRLADVAAGPTLAYAHRSLLAEGEQELLAHFVVSARELTDLESHIDVYRDRDNPELCQVLVQVNVLSRWPDFSGSRVVMINGEEKRSVLTGSDGRVLFQDIPVGDIEHLVFAVVPVTAGEADHPSG